MYRVFGFGPFKVVALGCGANTMVYTPSPTLRHKKTMGIGIVVSTYDLIYGLIKGENILGSRTCMMVVWSLFKASVRDSC